MKRVMIVVIVMVMLLGISEKALADVWSRCGLQSSYRFQHGGRRFLGGSFRTPLGSFRTPYGNVWDSCGLSSSGRNRSTLGKVLGYVRPGMNIVGGLHQMSVTNRVVSMHEREQDFRHQQIRTQNNTVLRTTVPVRRIIKIKPKKAQVQKSQEIQQLQQQIKELQIQLKELQQQAKK